MAVTPANQLKCRSCKQTKHRQLFVLHASSFQKKYDYYCNECRRDKKTYTPRQIAQRLADGLFTEEQAAIYKARNVERRKKRAAEIQKTIKKNEKKTWQPILNSAKRALFRVHYSFACTTAEEQEWSNKMAALIRESIAHIREREGKNPYAEAVTWADVHPKGVHAVREVVNSFPGDPGKCPIVIL